MAFSDFQYPSALQDLGLTLSPTEDLFVSVGSVPPGPILRASLPLGTQLGPLAHTEFSRAVWMVGPLLGDLWSRYHGSICLIGGAEFNADPAARLSGFCDFLICRAPQQSEIIAPVVVIFEAKRDSIPGGLGQCIAGMVGIERFNRRHNTPVDPVYGCVTTGTAWKFLRLRGAVLTFDLAEYTLTQADRLLGILTHIVGPVPPAVAA